MESLGLSRSQEGRRQTGARKTGPEKGPWAKRLDSGRREETGPPRLPELQTLGLTRFCGRAQNFRLQSRHHDLLPLLHVV